jgi:transcriptional regulator with XRE-family HTH domain
MNVGKTVLDARTAAKLSQRQLAARAGVPQSTVARIESGKLMPRVDTLDRILRAADVRVAVEPLPGAGVDRSQIREMLRRTPSRRFDIAVESSNNVMRLLASRKPLRGA